MWLFNMINAFGMQYVASKHPEQFKKGMHEGWLKQKWFVKNCEGRWKPTGKRERATTDEWYSTVLYPASVHTVPGYPGTV